MSTSTSHTTGATSHEAGMMGVGPRLRAEGTWSVRESEPKSGKKHGPPCLTRIQSPRCLDLLQITVVSPDEEMVLGPLKKVSQNLQGLYHS